jgi:hypothetical protein
VTSPVLQRAGVASAVMAVGLVTTSLAWAAQPVKSGHYHGKSRYNSVVSFRVSASGHRISKLVVPIPVGCQAGGIADLKPASARVTGAGTFKTRLAIRALDGQHLGTVTVTGRFESHGREKGKISSRFTHGLTSNCDATFPYTTKT